MTTAIKPFVLYNYDNKVVDFRLEGINGIFRVANSDGVNIEKTVERIQENWKFFTEFAQFNWSQTDTFTNWGGGWEWKETKHPLLAKGYRLGSATSWYTTPFAGYAKPVPVEQMHLLYRDAIKIYGVNLLWSYNHNRQPTSVAYFLPDA